VVVNGEIAWTQDAYADAVSGEICALT